MAYCTSANVRAICETDITDVEIDILISESDDILDMMLDMMLDMVLDMTLDPLNQV